MAVIVSDEIIKIERLTLGSWSTNTYIIVCRETHDSALIDAPAEASKILTALKDTNLKYILLTHNHTDHLDALTRLKNETKVPVAVHKADSHLPVKPDMFLKDGDTLSVGKLDIEVLHTPGHTPGGLCFRLGKYLMSGDTIFTAGPGRTPSPAAFKQIVEAITGKIFVLPDDTQIHPGHGKSTVLKKEKEEYAVFASRPHAPNLCGDVVWLES